MLIDSRDNKKAIQRYTNIDHCVSLDGNYHPSSSFSLRTLANLMIKSGVGRFTTRDTWGGNANSPMSLNRWNYTNANPVNYTDPSGHLPILCQSMPNKAMYEGCVDLYYGIEPISYSEMGQNVTGSRGCYKGPTIYRATGYLEGIEWWLFPWRMGREIVYDFARMERAKFEFYGAGANDAADIGVGLSIYGGYAMGLRSDTVLVKHYLGESTAAQVGASGDVGVGIGGGIGVFYSVSDKMLRGVTWYVGGSLSGDLVEILDFNRDITLDYSPLPGTEKPYGLADHSVNLGPLLVDIMSGDSTVWGFHIPLPGFGNIHVTVNSHVMTASRAYGAFLAIRGAKAYQEIWNANSK